MKVTRKSAEKVALQYEGTGLFSIEKEIEVRLLRQKRGKKGE